ncbi:MAG: hypothetical protein MRECE_43c007 [Mycoplasmataceae bacterium CE_OT135]|nr:MAG: hypothetical protein MRECE_43c007 [Mycoplasmataceae bacterium CE_OT135]
MPILNNNLKEQNADLQHDLNNLSHQNTTLYQEKHQIQQELTTAKEKINQLKQKLTNEQEQKTNAAENNLIQEKQNNSILRQQLLRLFKSPARPKWKICLSAVSATPKRIPKTIWGFWLIAFIILHHTNHTQEIKQRSF